MPYPILSICVWGAIAVVCAALVGRLLDRYDLEQAKPNLRLGCVDGLRGFLAVSVIVHHFVVWLQVTRLHAPWGGPSIAFFNQLGTGAVSLFFMATGFVFYPRILNGFRNTQWLKLFTGRVFRIVPMVAVSTAVIVLIIGARTGHWFDRSLPLGLVYWLTAYWQPPLLGYAESGRLDAYVLWSLRYEWIFYFAIFPVCAIIVDLIRGRLPTWTLPVALVLISVLAQATHAPGTIWVFLPLFAFGMMACELQRRERIVEALRSPLVSVLALAGLLSAMLLSAEPYGWSMPFFGFFFFAVACGNSLFGVLRRRGSVALGNISYSIYLLHGIVLNLLFTEGASVIAGIDTAWLPVLLPGVVALSVVLSTLTYRWVELPMMKFGGRVGSLLTQSTSAPAAELRATN